jgi:hypothetical protein
MYKWLAMVGLLVLVGIISDQNPPAGTPKVGVAKSDGGSKRQEQPNGQPGNQPTPPTVTSTPQPATPACDETCQQGRQNLKIQSRLVWLTGGLVLVGFLQGGSMIWQAILLWKTRDEVHRQADWTETQTGRISRQADLMNRQNVFLKESIAIARESAEAAKASAEVALAQINAMKSKERAKLSFELDPFSPHLYFKSSPWAQPINWRVKLHGQSEAWDVKSPAIFCVGEPTKHLFFGFHSLNLPSILSPTLREYSGQLVLHFHDSEGQTLGEDTLEKLESGKTSLFFSGSIEYTDVYGDRWILPIRRRWVYFERRIPAIEKLAASAGGYWMEEGNNKEQKQQP